MHVIAVLLLFKYTLRKKHSVINLTLGPCERPFLTRLLNKWEFEPMHARAGAHLRVHLELLQALAQQRLVGRGELHKVRRVERQPLPIPGSAHTHPVSVLAKHVGPAEPETHNHSCHNTDQTWRRAHQCCYAPQLALQTNKPVMCNTRIASRTKAHMISPYLEHRFVSPRQRLGQHACKSAIRFSSIEHAREQFLKRRCLFLTKRGIYTSAARETGRGQRTLAPGRQQT